MVGWLIFYSQVHLIMVDIMVVVVVMAVGFVVDNNSETTMRNGNYVDKKNMIIGIIG